MFGVLIRREEIQTDTERMPFDGGGRDWSYAAAASQGTQRLPARGKEGFIIGFRGSRALLTP